MIREGKSFERNVKRIGLVLAVLFLLLLAQSRYQQEHLANSLSEKVIRFHVKANSDTKEDQELKLKVRDAIGAYLQEELKGATDLEKSRRIIKENMKEIEKTAQQVVKEQGYSYRITASLARVDFPVKTYGDYVFPKGEYEALQIIIGQGEGENWWCVMYPNMCFYNSVYEVVDENAETSLKRVLTAKEYDAVMKSENVQFKCKWLTFFNTLLE